MLTNESRVVLMDFGTGREFGDGPAASVAGTPLYLAPELLAGGDATVASDLYGVGVLLYHLLTGSYPVPGDATSPIFGVRTSEGIEPILPARARISHRSWSASSSARSIRSPRDVHTVRRRSRATSSHSGRARS